MKFDHINTCTLWPGDSDDDPLSLLQRQCKTVLTDLVCRPQRLDCHSTQSGTTRKACGLLESY